MTAPRGRIEPRKINVSATNPSTLPSWRLSLGAVQRGGRVEGFLFMKLYFAEWQDKSVTIVHATGSFQAYHLLSQVGEPETASVWVADGPASIITHMGPDSRMTIHRDLDYRWSRVIMPKYESVYGRGRSF